MKQRACLKLIELLCLSFRNQVSSRAHLRCSPNLNLTAPSTDDASFSLELKGKAIPKEMVVKLIERKSEEQAIKDYERRAANR